jgi:hypothetical protein
MKPKGIAVGRTPPPPVADFLDIEKRFGPGRALQRLSAAVLIEQIERLCAHR